MTSSSTLPFNIPPPQLYYDGQAQVSTSNHQFPSINPSTGSLITPIPSASNADIDAAVISAQSAFPSWRATPPIERSRILLKAASILRARNDDLARLETVDTGKPFSETSTVDIPTGADVLEYYAHLVAGGGLNGESIQLRPDAWVYTRKEPLGVCVGIGAWNYPLQIALWKSAPCLAAGNTMVYKPSEITSLHARVLAEIYTEAGLPAGVFNVILGDGKVGSYLVSHPGISKVSFTGQVSTGQLVASSAAGGMKSVTMELGGKSPLIILPDADLNQAADLAMMANFWSSGQVCTNGTRVFIPASKSSEFEQKILERMKNIRAGDVMDLKTNYGPLSSKAHRDKVLGYIRIGIEQDKARLLCGGLEPMEDGIEGDLKNGCWIQPTVFTNCTDDMIIVKEEIFGPVMCLLTYEDVDEVVKRANDTPLGLAAGVMTRDVNKAHQIAGRLEAGIIWINSWGESPAEMSVGGWKMSGVGVENGKRGLEAWVRNKSTLVELGGNVETVFK
ncbi:MAG: hypothetical protein M1823_000233 [Watsoniomyces obsoletus]|nr:MAG: hypothetical protein M1823_000233 [Watsoniomyces obsoletus]